MKRNFDYSKVKYYKFFPIAKVIARIFFPILFRIKCVGKENIPKDGKFILASNHLSAFDPVVYCVVMPRRVFFLGKEELFEKKFNYWILTHLQGIPIKRDKGDLSAIEYSIKVLKEGNILGIFPEGTRSKTGRPLPARAGVALIANKTEADVLPVCIYFEGKMRIFKKVTIRFGKLIKNEELRIENGRASELKAATHLIMDSIVSMWEEGHCK